MNFTCPRTCPLAGQFWCRFRAVTDAIGPVRVNSHTAKITVEYRDLDALKSAVESMQGKWLGAGSHQLYQGPYTGTGFQLEGWRYPCVLDQAGDLHFDNFDGRWGDAVDLDRLKGAYCLAAAEQAAHAQGWLCQRTDTGLVVHHPSGGALTITPDGALDAAGFVGTGCHDAILQLGLPMSDLQAKPEYSAVQAQVNVAE